MLNIHWLFCLNLEQLQLSWKEYCIIWSSSWSEMLLLKDLLWNVLFLILSLSLKRNICRRKNIVTRATINIETTSLFSNVIFLNFSLHITTNYLTWELRTFMQWMKILNLYVSALYIDLTPVTFTSGQIRVLLVKNLVIDL